MQNLGRAITPGQSAVFYIDEDIVFRRRENSIGAFENYINELKVNINKKGNLSEIEIVRYIYINLGQKMNFDLNYTFGNRKERDKIYNAKLNSEEIDKLFENKTIICKSLAIMLRKILEEFNIKCIVESNSNYGNSKHVYNIVNLKDGRKLKIDLEEDLEYIQTGSRTKFFKILDDILDKEKDLPKEELEFIDKTTAEYIPWGFYFDDMIGILKLGIKGMTIDNKLKNVLDNLDVYVKDMKIGYRDRVYYHNRVFQELFSKKELNKIHQIDCYKMYGSEKKFVSCIVLDKLHQDEENIVYLYTEEGKYQQITLEQLAIEINNGLVMLQGVQGLRKYLNSSVKYEMICKNTSTVRNLLETFKENYEENYPDI